MSRRRSSLPVPNSLNGADIEDYEGKFHFQINQADENGDEISGFKSGNFDADATGKINYPSIVITAGGTYYYKVTESSIDTSDIHKFDANGYLVKVVVSNDLETVTYQYKKLDKGGKPEGSWSNAAPAANGLDFTNVYQKTEVQPGPGPVGQGVTFIKKVNGENYSGGAYTFALRRQQWTNDAWAGTGSELTTTTVQNGKITLPKLTFTAADIGKTYIYKLTEKTGSDKNTVYDTEAEYWLAFHISAKADDGTLQVYYKQIAAPAQDVKADDPDRTAYNALTALQGAANTFCNDVYTPSAGIVLKARKEFKTADIEAGKTVP